MGIGARLLLASWQDYLGAILVGPDLAIGQSDFLLPAVQPGATSSNLWKPGDGGKSEASRQEQTAWS